MTLLSCSDEPGEESVERLVGPTSQRVAARPAEHKADVEHFISEARRIKANCCKERFFVLAMWVGNFERGLVEYLEMLNDPKASGFGGNAALIDAGGKPVAREPGSDKQ